MDNHDDIRGLIDKAQQYLPSSQLAHLHAAYEFAAAAYQAQGIRAEDRLDHCLRTAVTVAELQLDVNCITAALLHDVAEHCGVSSAQIEERFGADIARLVEGVSRLSRISWMVPGEQRAKKGTSDAEAQAESLRRMLMAMAEDVRVVFIKLADRLCLMRTIDRMPPQKRRAIAEETMEIYAPVAHRLGIWEIKWQLEDKSFHVLEPRQYREIVKMVKGKRREREDYIARVTEMLEQELGRAGISAEVSGRPKNIYSIYRKMVKYAAQGKDVNEIYDLFGLRVLVNGVQDCYRALGVIHSLWHPIPDKFDDYIANPREGVYQSLHTAVMYEGTTPLEVQIRTHEMHRVAEYGIAAHWRYEEGGKRDPRFEEKIAVLRQLLEWYQDIGGAEFLDSMRTDVFGDRVFVYTPKGDIKDMPANSTPLDFAYRIHTDLGHRCIGAKVNGRMIPLTYHLQNGDTVEILATKADRGPSRDWLNHDLGYITTSHAREKVRQWFRRQERAENIQRGRELLEKELRRIGVSLSEEELADLFKRDSAEDFLAAVGSGDISTHHIASKLAVQQERAQVPLTAPRQQRAAAIEVMGVGDLLTHIAPCCHPMPGDEIIGYVTRTKGISVHCRDCPNVANLEDKERLIRVEWGSTDQYYSASVRIEAWDRVGLLRDISSVVAEDRVNITAVSTKDHDDQTISILLTLETKGIQQLSRLLTRLERVRGVMSVNREG